MPIRIMVINDDQDILALYEDLLKEEGYDVITSKLAFEHPAAVEMLRPDLVMLDLKFGTRIEGWKMMQKLRLYRPTASLPIIICTAAVREAREQEEHLRSEGIGIVYKPFAIDHLLLAVRQVLATVESSQTGHLRSGSQIVEAVPRARAPLAATPATNAVND
ncbi:MAG TPA: response regulator [Ktedonobacterales bacterium]|nr:response regulator [Ktedonobacterales bacterium]